MANYRSEDVTLRRPAAEVWHKLSDLENLRSLLSNVPADSLPADKREMFEKVEITPDTITIPGGPVGSIKLRMKEKLEPSLIRLEGEGTPVPLSLAMHITPAGEDACVANVEFDIAIPAMLKPMVNGPLQELTAQFANLLRAIPM